MCKPRMRTCTQCLAGRSPALSVTTDGGATDEECLDWLQAPFREVQGTASLHAAHHSN